MILQAPTKIAPIFREKAIFTAMTAPPPASPPTPTPQRPKKDSFLVNSLARLLILGEKLGPFLRPVLIVGAILIALLLLGFVPRILRGRRLAAESRAQGQLQSVPGVTITRVEQSPTRVTLTLPGNVEPIELTQLSARTTGYVKRYLADIGDRVREGQVLAEIETPEVDQQAQQAQAELARSQATLAQSGAQLAQQGAALQTSRANAARAGADLSRAVQNTAQQRAQIREGRANAELARVTWTRWQNLVAGGAISQQEADEKQAAYNSAIANVSALEAALRAGNSDVSAYKAAQNAALADVSAAGENVKAYREAVNAARAGVAAARSNVARFGVLSGFREVRAPYAGVITARNVDEGALISAGGAVSSPASATSETNSSPSGSGSVASPQSGSSGTGNTGLFTLARLDSLRIYVDVPQTDAGNIRAGQEASISIRELPKQVFRGRIGRTSRSLNQATRTLRAEVSLPNQSGVLLPGMYAQVKIEVPRPGAPMLVPSGALISDARGNRIATVGDGKVRFHTVEIGRDFGESLEITRGLRAGEDVVTNPTDDLREGGKVKTTVAQPPKDPSGGGSGGAAKPGNDSKKQGDQKGSEDGQSAPKKDKFPSLNAKAKKQSAQQGGESTEPRAQPGGAERDTALQKQKAAQEKKPE